MSEKVMRGWVHIAAIILGIGLPAGLTMNTLRTGANFEVVATPKQVVENVEKSLAGHDAGGLNRFIAPDVVTHRSVAQDGAGAFIQAATADAIHTQALTARKVSANASLVMVESAASGTDGSIAPVVQIYRVYGGKIVEYWAAEPLHSTAARRGAGAWAGGRALTGVPGPDRARANDGAD